MKPLTALLRQAAIDSCLGHADLAKKTLYWLAADANESQLLALRRVVMDADHFDKEGNLQPVSEHAITLSRSALKRQGWPG